MKKSDLRIRIHHKKVRLEDRLVLDTNLPERFAGPLFRAGDAFEWLCCRILGHAWDGWMNQPGVWCVFCGKQERRGVVNE